MNITSAIYPHIAPIKNGNQKKRYPIMPFENNNTLQKLHMTNTPPETDKYGTRRKMALYKNGTTKNGASEKWYNLQKDA